MTGNSDRLGQITGERICWLALAMAGGNQLPACCMGEARLAAWSLWPSHVRVPVVAVAGGLSPLDPQRQRVRVIACAPEIV